MATKKPKTPIASWPGGANPQTVENLGKNLTEARKRLDECIAKKGEAWNMVMENSEAGFIQNIVRWRDQSEEQSKWISKLEALIEKWQDKLRDLSAREVVVEQEKTTHLVYLHGHEQQRQGQ